MQREFLVEVKREEQQTRGPDNDRHAPRKNGMITYFLGETEVAPEVNDILI